MSDAYMGDGEFYCEDCAADFMACYPDGGGEADCPQNCACCHRPLENPLTTDGVAYVLQAAREELRKGRDEYRKAHPCYDGTYYEESPHVAIIRDWIKPLIWYNLPEGEASFVRHFLSWTA